MRFTGSGRMGRQSCLAHLIREAKGLSERNNPVLSRPGAWALKELQLLCRMAKDLSSECQWNLFYARLIRLIGLYRDQPDEAGKFVRRLQREIGSLWLFLLENGVAPTNNHAERTLCFAVLWRKRNFGTRVEKGNTWVERILASGKPVACKAKEPFPSLLTPCRHTSTENIQAYTGFIPSTAPTHERLHVVYTGLGIVGTTRRISISPKTLANWISFQRKKAGIEGCQR
jgi:hypothetical protein